METHIAWIDAVDLLTVIVEDLPKLQDIEKPPTIYWEAKDLYFQAKVGEILNDSTVNMSFVDILPMGEDLILLWGEEKIPIYPRAIVRTDWFDHHYSDLNTTLGVIYEDSVTTFSIWAPTAISVKLAIDNHLQLLNRQENGIWKLKINGDWHGFAYHYEIVINGKTKRVNDPYAKAMLANSEKGVIVDLSKTDNPIIDELQRPKVENLADSIIYELHVRDATMHENSGVINRGIFLGLTETETTTDNGFSTALSYIKELGCTHVQLLPINDFARVDETNPTNDYNWGYDPLFFQVPEGSYATTPMDPLSRIKEAKQMIQAFHQEGISVILDVVYNHVFIMEESPFEKIVPGYYFRYHPDGIPSNGTGVGNDLATERNMVRKFILDTIDFWLKEYKVDGFRFDLMGAIDIETMQLIEQRCATEPVPIMLLGEGWEIATAMDAIQMATSSNSHQLQGVRFFNDYFRDSLKGNLFHHDDFGYINGNGHFVERLPHLVTGSVFEEYGTPFVSDVNQTINFVECHDNHTLWDRLLLSNGGESESTRKKMHQLATGITLLSQGVPFIHAGQEWFGSKQGDENSYISGDEINQLNWEKRELENENIAFIKALIRLRKKHTVFRLTSKEEIRRRLHIINTPDPVFGFTLLGSNQDFSIYINPTKEHFQLHLPFTGEWEVIISNIAYKSTVKQEVNSEFTTIRPYEFVVFKKSVNSR